MVDFLQNLITSRSSEIPIVLNSWLAVFTYVSDTSIQRYESILLIIECKISKLPKIVRFFSVEQKYGYMKCSAEYIYGWTDPGKGRRGKLLRRWVEGETGGGSVAVEAQSDDEVALLLSLNTIRAACHAAAEPTSRGSWANTYERRAARRLTPLVLRALAQGPVAP